jgi:uncharacterized protein
MAGMSADTGAALSEREHILQSVATLIRTPVGSRIQRRDYGSLIPELIDQPLNVATQLRLYSATAAAILTWEPRATPTSITLVVGSDGSATLDLELAINDELVNASVEIK